MLQIFVQSLLIGYSGAVMPGSLLTYTIDRSLRHGAKSGMLVPLGHVLLEFVLVVAVFLGLGKYLDTAGVQLGVGILGGLLLIILGLKMVKEALDGTLQQSGPAEAEKRKGSLLWAGALLSLGNPYFLIWWAVVGLGLIVNAYSLFGVLGIALFYCGHICADLTWYGLVAILVSKTRALFSGKAYSALVVVLGFCLIVFGGSFLLNSLRTLLKP